MSITQRQHRSRATLEVRASNQIAIDLYQRSGFKVASTRKKYYQNPTEDRLVMWLGRLSELALPC